MFDITRSETDGVLILAGTLDISSSDELRKALSDCLNREPEVKVDLSRADACDTAALQVLYSLHKSAGMSHKIFRITALSEAVEKMVTALGLSLSHFTA